MKNRIVRRNIPTPNASLGRRTLITSLLFLIPVLGALFLTVMVPLEWWLGEQDFAFPNLQASKFLQTNLPSEGTEPLLNPEIRQLVIEELFWKNRLELSKIDSFTASIDLVDSVITLEIEGVPVRLCSIIRYDIGWSLNYFRQHPDFIKWLASPFTVQSDTATIPKAPVVVINAPKDTIEAKALLGEYPEEDVNYIQFVFQLDRNLQIEIRQVESLPESKRTTSSILSFNDEITSVLAKVPDQVKMSVPSDRFRILIYLDNSDAKALYRALPRNASLSLRL